MNGQLEHDNIVNHTNKAHVKRDMNATTKGTFMGIVLFHPKTLILIYGWARF